MNQATLLSILRSALTLGGVYLLGHNLFGHPIDASLWQEITGAVVAVGSSVWGILDKSATVEGISSLIRSALVALGALLLSLGVLNQQTFEGIMGLLTAVLPIVLGQTNRVKDTQLANGKLGLSSTDGQAKVVSKPTNQN